MHIGTSQPGGSGADLDSAAAAVVDIVILDENIVQETPGASGVDVDATRQREVRRGSLLVRLASHVVYGVGVKSDASMRLAIIGSDKDAVAARYRGCWICDS